MIIAVLALLVTLTVAVSYAVKTANVPGDTNVALPQEVAGPAWETEPQPVPSTFFGVTMNSTSGMMPSFRVGSVRFWDSETRWANLLPERDQFSWSTLDRLVTGANQAGLSIVQFCHPTPWTVLTPINLLGEERAMNRFPCLTANDLFECTMYRINRLDGAHAPVASRS